MDPKIQEAKATGMHPDDIAVQFLTEEELAEYIGLTEAYADENREEEISTEVENSALYAMITGIVERRK